MSGFHFFALDGIDLTFMKINLRRGTEPEDFVFRTCNLQEQLQVLTLPVCLFGFFLSFQGFFSCALFGFFLVGTFLSLFVWGFFAGLFFFSFGVD